ncbi:MAG TPA: hypothetical protein VNZ22_09390, partial [Bacillota bacterium]|nr:hypothetical protein [Bacillota bacterium]
MTIEYNADMGVQNLGGGTPDLIGLPISRREALRLGLLGAAGMLLAGSSAGRALAAARPAKAKSVIQIWMWGGPCHLDTFDPKPEAGSDYS